jgi:endonuclease YncB( thermonuclease family)
LGWSHYQALLALPTRAERDFYVREAARAHWSVRELRARIRAGAFGHTRREGTEPAAPAAALRPNLQPIKGVLYTYRLIASPEGPASPPWLDRGFEDYLALSPDDVSGLRPGQIVESVRDDGAANGFRLQASGRSRNACYTYSAIVQSVVDGDTLWVFVDLGFRSWTCQKLRLRGIDAPELATEAGKRCREFVAGALRDAPSIAVKTTRPDKYGRYLADIYYLSGERDGQAIVDNGVFLNGELLERGLATAFTG